MMRTSRPLRHIWAGIDNSATAASSFSLPPSFLCPALRDSARRPDISQRRRYALGRTAKPAVLAQTRCIHAEAAAIRPQPPAETFETLPAAQLPSQCPGCGALSQTSVPDEPGFFDIGKRKSLQKYLGLVKDEPRIRANDRVVSDALGQLEDRQLQELGLDPHLILSHSMATSPDVQGSSVSGAAPPLCDRCHQLVHHSAGVPAHFPTIDAIRDTIEESPYKYNYVYHVLDAADFPMSLLPRIRELLDLMPLRTRNRRAKSGKFYGDQKTELSFIITRSDLFAPRKDQVDRLMPWITDTLREALGRAGRKARLGNIHCVSAKRSWWTKELKEEIWKRGGATWMVGKANVGKSYLFQHVFPKGRMNWQAPAHQIEIPVSSRPADGPARVEGHAAALDQLHQFQEDSLLPPAQVETEYPQMPVVSSLPGTTASPIRIPFGKGRGELIDLPGLFRSSIVDYVDPTHSDNIIMKSRIQPEQQSLKPGQSMLMGGFIRITPQTPNLTFLAYNFTPLREHKTATDKAIEIQAQTSDLNVENIAKMGTGAVTKLAGSYQLKYDVTKERAGPITRRDAVNIKVENLPYRVLATDILIEGCGWVEIVAQVRAKDLFKPAPKPEESEEILQTLDLSEPPQENMGQKEADGSDKKTSVSDGEPNWPIVEVFTPEGKFVGSRRPLNAWLKCQPKRSSVSRGRPRKSMKGAKKGAKREARARQGVAT